MQLFSMCMECQKELGHPTFEPFIVPYYDDRVAYSTCSRGHKSAHIVQSQKFEVLMESGANAFNAGFTLEAAASFSAALERFFEFSIRVILSHRGVEMPLFEKMFTEMARQSERQIGAFLALHALEFGTPYNLNTDIVKFRNSVIHKGFIPDPEMAEDFCSKVYLEIFNLTQKLRSLSSDSIQKVIMHDLAVRYQKIETGTAKATASGGIFFGIIKTDNKPSFKEALETYRDAKNVLTSSMSTLQSIHNSILNAPKIG